MNSKPLGANATEVTFENVKVLFSYQTPVVYEILSGDQSGIYKTDKFWSRTTSKHINKWLDGRDAGLVEQQYFDKAIAGVKLS